MAKTYFGGQIKDVNRGHLVAIVILDREKDQYGTILTTREDQDYVYATCPSFQLRNPMERAYLDVNQRTGEEITQRTDRLRRKDPNLAQRLYEIDEYVVDRRTLQLERL